MHAADALVRHDEPFDLLHELLLRRLAEQRADRIARRLHPRPEDHARDDQSDPSIDHQPRETADEHRREHRRRRNAVGEAVRCGGLHGHRVDFSADAPVIQAHVEFHAHGNREDHRRQGAEIHCLRVQHLLERRLRQLRAHQQDQPRHDQPRDIFHPSVAEGVLRVWLFPRETEAQQRHHRRARVREVVECVRRDGDRAADRPGKELPHKEHEVQRDAHHPAQLAIGAAHGGICDIVAVFDKQVGQKCNHIFSFSARGPRRRRVTR